MLWRSIVNVNSITLALKKLKDINVFYRIFSRISESSLDDRMREVIETVDSTASTMLVKASKEDVATFQKYTIRTLNEKNNTENDISQCGSTGYLGMVAVLSFPCIRYDNVKF